MHRANWTYQNAVLHQVFRAQAKRITEIIDDLVVQIMVIRTELYDGALVFPWLIPVHDLVLCKNVGCCVVVFRKSCYCFDRATPNVNDTVVCLTAVSSAK